MGSKKEVKFVVCNKDKSRTVMEEKMVEAGVIVIRTGKEKTNAKIL